MTTMKQNNPNSHSHSNPQTGYDASLAQADLGAARFDHDVAAASDRDHAIALGLARSGAHSAVLPGVSHVPKHMEKVAFKWSALQYTDENRNEREEDKEDLHGGQLHRQNRMARAEMQRLEGAMMVGGGSGGSRGFYAGTVRFGGGGAGGPGVRRGDRRGGRGGRFEEGSRGVRVAAKPDEEVRPEAKGMGKEMSDDMFWNERIV